jgi:hypothetical protein
MEIIQFDLSKTFGSFKMMNATNGGPFHKRHATDQWRSNFADYKAARMPYSRNHDSGIASIYGGPYSHDISNIFRDFNADPEDPASYDFGCTDEEILKGLDTGTETYFRLGQTIEHHIVKHFIKPPKDFKKWAIICEHIIKHYTKGWANGLFLDMRYFEVWCEPDNVPACWTGTIEQYYDLYEITAKHLKSCFPEILIGGASFAEWSVDEGGIDAFLDQVKERNAPLDFLSWHTYSRKLEDFTRRARSVRNSLDARGFYGVESILNEWNYLINWNEGLRESIRRVHTAEGAAHIGAVLSIMQNESVDKMMHYSVQPASAWNGVFDFSGEYSIDVRRKSYYAFLFFSRLYALGNQLTVLSDDKDIYVLAATNGAKTGVMVTYYTYDSKAEDKTVFIDLPELENYTARLMDNASDGDEVEFSGAFTMKPNSILFLESK